MEGDRGVLDDVDRDPDGLDPDDLEEDDEPDDLDDEREDDELRDEPAARAGTLELRETSKMIEHVAIALRITGLLCFLWWSPRAPSITRLRAVVTMMLVDTRSRPSQVFETRDRAHAFEHASSRSCRAMCRPRR